MNEGSASACPISDHDEAAADAPAVAPSQRPPDPLPILVFDRYLRKSCHLPAKQLGQVLLPCHLVRAAMFFHAQRSRHLPPPFPPGQQLEFLPLQMQRFLRSCVLATAHALCTPPASVFVNSRTESCCIKERIFVRVMSGFVARAEVRRQGARLSFASAHIVL